MPVPRRILILGPSGSGKSTLARCIGERLGIPAHMSHLVRKRSGPFTLEQALTLEQIEAYAEEGTIVQRLQPLQSALPHLPKTTIPEVLERRVLNGRELTLRWHVSGADVDSLVRIESRDGQLLALYRVLEVTAAETHTKPEKVFKE